MEIKITKNSEKAVVSLTGRLDTNTAPQMQQAMAEVFDQSVSWIILDLADLVYVSSAGLRVLLLSEKAARAGKITMTLENVSPDVLEVFEITGFTNILHIIR